MIKKVCGHVEELVNTRMKHSRLYVILHHLVLSAKSVYNFWQGVMALAPHAAPLFLLLVNKTPISPLSFLIPSSFYVLPCVLCDVGHVDSKIIYFVVKRVYCWTMCFLEAYSACWVHYLTTYKLNQTPIKSRSWCIIFCCCCYISMCC